MLLNIKEIHEKLSCGDRLTDDELYFATEFFKNLSDSLLMLGPTYYLAWKEAHSTLLKLETFVEGRRYKKHVSKWGHEMGANK